MVPLSKRVLLAVMYSHHCLLFLSDISHHETLALLTILIYDFMVRPEICKCVSTGAKSLRKNEGLSIFATVLIHFDELVHIQK